MRILFLSSIFPHQTAPVCGTFNFEICRALARQHDVRVVAPRSWLDVLRDPARKNSDQRPNAVRDAGIRVSYPTYIYPPKILRNHYGDFMWLSITRHVRKLLKEFTPDCVVSYWAHPDGEAGLRAAQLVGVPSAVIVGGTDVLLLPNDPGRRKRICRVLFKSDAVISVSDGLNRRVVELGTDADRVHTVYQGIDPSVFYKDNQTAARNRLGIDPRAKTLVWVGRMVPVKGLEIMLAAFQQLRQQGVAFQAHLVGVGPLRETLQADAAARGLSDCVHFAGSVEHGELPDWYRAADGMVMSSWSEGLPNVLRESLACGTPFVSTDVGSITEITDPKHGILVPPGDAAALATAMNRLLSGNFAAAAARYQARTWSETADNLCDVMEPLVARNATNLDRFELESTEAVCALK